MTKNVKSILCKIKNIIDHLAIVGFFYILLYQVEGVRKLCKAIIVYFINWTNLIDITSVKEWYFEGEKILRFFILISVIMFIILKLIQVINDQILKKRNGRDSFEQSLFRYLHETMMPHCFLVTGPWGAGKSYRVNHFFEKYYANSSTKVYRISCFGLNNRSELINEINNVIEQEDHSFSKKLIEMMQMLPIIGNFFYELLKKNYGYENVRKLSIFIFDDFERISVQSSIDDFLKKSLRNNQIYDGKVHSQTGDAIYELNRSINNCYSDTERLISGLSLKLDYEKYISITGFISELIEQYNMKVIVICNNYAIDKSFIYNVLKSKLNCLEFKQESSSVLLYPFINNLIENKIIADDGKQKCIKQYLHSISGQIKIVMLDDEIFQNMRFLGTLLDAFIDTADLFETNQLTEDFLTSLFNSILIVIMKYYKDGYESVSKEYNLFRSGSNIEFLYSLFGHSEHVPYLIRPQNTNKGLKWVNIKISGYWILNLEKPREKKLKTFYNECQEYPYYEFEEQLLVDSSKLLDAKEYNFMHVLFYFEKQTPETLQLWDFKKYIHNALLQTDLESLDLANQLLSEYYDACGAYYGRDVQNALGSQFKAMCENFEIAVFNELYMRRKYESVYGVTQFHIDYNKFIFDRELK